MGTTIRRSVGDTDPLIYELKEKLIYEDRSRPISLLDKDVYLTMVNSYLEVPTLDSSRQFANITERDQYYAANPDELIDGLITTYVDGTTVVCRIWRGGQWNADYWVIVDDKACTIRDEGKGYVGYPFTVEEVRRAGMFHVYFRVETSDGTPVVTTSAKYPKGDSLWIHIMDVFTE